jgi:hypothetical protein
MDIPADSKELLALQESLRAQGVEKLPVCRHVHWEYALPRNEQEYIDLHGFAVLRLEANSEVRKELPVKTAYFRYDQKEQLTLPRIRLGDELDNKITDKSLESGNEHFIQISFWIFPIWLLNENDSVLLADFTEGRDGFSLQSGPWNNKEYILNILNKHVANELCMGSKINNTFLTSFLVREFPGRF